MFTDIALFKTLSTLL